MLVIVSDLHLNDGTAGSRLDPGAMELLADRLSDLAYRASWRADGTYQPLDRIDLVLLGDTLDLMNSRRWLQTASRPWHDLRSAPVVDTLNGIVEDILRVNTEAIRHLRSLATENNVTVPLAANAAAAYRDEIPVAVRTHMMVGNTDWPLHLAGPSYDVLRHKVAHHLGLVNQHNRPFPHESSESEELHDALRRHRVLARHGDVFDPLSFSEGRDCCSLSDAISIELVGRFVSRLEEEFGSQLSAAARHAIGEIHDVRPSPLAAAWMESRLERTIPQPSLRLAIKRMWDTLVDELLQLEAVRQHNRWSPIDLIDGLGAALKFSRRDAHDWTGRTLTWLASLRGAEGCSYVGHAMAEPEFRNRRARHIVYGHTHQHECLPLDSSHADGFVLSQTYFNAGSWRRSFRPTKVVAGQQEFVGADTCSMLAFYQSDERSGRPYEIWSGALAPPIADVAASHHAAEMAPVAVAPIRTAHMNGAALVGSRGY